MAIPFKYNRRSLLIRRVSNAMTVGAIAIVVGVFVAAMAIVGGLDSAIKDSSAPDNMILLGRSADSEANSFITLAQLDALKFLPAIKRGHWFSVLGTAKFRGFVGKLGSCSHIIIDPIHPEMRSMTWNCYDSSVRYAT